MWVQDCWVFACTPAEDSKCPGQHQKPGKCGPEMISDLVLQVLYPPGSCCSDVPDRRRQSTAHFLALAVGPSWDQCYCVNTKRKDVIITKRDLGAWEKAKLGQSHDPQSTWQWPGIKIGTDSFLDGRFTRAVKDPLDSGTLNRAYSSSPSRRLWCSASGRVTSFGKWRTTTEDLWDGPCAILSDHSFVWNSI